MYTQRWPDIYHYLEFNGPHDVEKAFRGLGPSHAWEKQWLDLGANLEENLEAMGAHLCQIEG